MVGWNVPKCYKTIEKSRISRKINLQIEEEQRELDEWLVSPSVCGLPTYLRFFALNVFTFF